MGRRSPAHHRGAAPAGWNLTSLAFLIDQLFAAVPGGQGAYVRELVPALARADPSLDITLFHSRRDPGPASPQRTLGEPWLDEHRIIELNRPASRLYPLWAVAGRPALPRSLASREVVHSPVVAAVPPAGSGQRMVVTVHDLAFLKEPGAFPIRWRLMYRAGLARAVRRADALIAVSGHTADDLLHHAPEARGRIHVVPLAPALPEGAAAVDEVLDRLGVVRPYLLFVGTLERRKNVATLIRAYRVLAARRPAPALVLAGPQGWRAGEQLEGLSRGGPGPGRIIRTGHLSPVDLDALYRGAAAFVYPSLYEGFGLPVLEAMARGIPCIVSASSSLPEVAGQAALLIDPRSGASLTEAMDRITRDPFLPAHLAGLGREQAARYSWEQTARLTLEVYRALS